jgi:hypothetical protein
MEDGLSRGNCQGIYSLNDSALLRMITHNQVKMRNVLSGQAYLQQVIAG